MFVSTSPRYSVRSTGVPLLVLAGVAWGTGGLLGSLIGRETGLAPLAVAAYRLGLGGLLVLVAVGALGRGGGSLLGAAGHRRAALRRIGLLAVLAATFQACYFTAVSLTSVGLATLVTIGTAPVVVVAVEALGGRARKGALPVVALALLGLGLLVGMPTSGVSPFTGATAAVLAGSAFAVMTLIGARPVPGLDATTATGAAFTVGGLLLAVPAAVIGGLTFPPTPVGIALLGLFAVVPTALAYTAYFRGLGAATSPGTGAVLALLEPLTAAVLAAVVLGERLVASGVVGALLLAVAVVLAARADRR